MISQTLIIPLFVLLLVKKHQTKEINKKIKMQTKANKGLSPYILPQHAHTKKHQQLKAQNLDFLCGVIGLVTEVIRLWLCHRLSCSRASSHKRIIFARNGHSRYKRKTFDTHKKYRNTQSRANKYQATYM